MYSIDFEHAEAAVNESLPIIHSLYLPLTVGESDTAESIAEQMKTEEFPVIHLYLYDPEKEAWDEKPINLSNMTHICATNTTTEGEGQDAVDTVHASISYVRPVDVTVLAVDFDSLDAIFFDPYETFGCYVVYNPTDHSEYSYINELDGTAFDETLIAKNAPWILEESE